LAIDGPKNLQDRLNQEIIAKHIDEISVKSESRIHVHNRTYNAGIAESVIRSIDWFFSKEKCGLILEDDLRISTSLPYFAAKSLEKFSDNPDVWMISGSQFFPEECEPNKIAYCNYPIIWGWAGWANKWAIMRSTLLTHKKIKFNKLINKKYLFWAIGANRALSGKVDTWDIELAFEFLFNNKLCVMPPINLVSNVGFDKVSTNTKVANSFMNLEISNLLEMIDFDFSPSLKSIKNYNYLLEKKVFKLKTRHLLIPYYSMLLDSFRFPSSKRKLPLKERLY